MKRPRVNFTIDEQILNELDFISKELGKKKSHIVEEALEFYFDLLDVEIAKSRLNKMKKGEVKPIPLGEVLEEFGLK